MKKRYFSVFAGAAGAAILGASYALQPPGPPVVWKDLREDVPKRYVFALDKKLGYNAPLPAPAGKVAYWRAFDPAAPAGGPTPEEIIAQDDSEKRASEPLQGKGCGPGMVRVSGKMQHWDLVQKLQERQPGVCLDSKTWSPGKLCNHFDRTKLDYAAAYAKLSPAEQKRLAPKQMDYCIDRYEYPNVPGEYPIIMVTYLDGRALCEKQGKRLCTEEEWVFSCEGEKATPYPWGYDRDGGDCNVDVDMSGMPDPTPAIQSRNPVLITQLFNKIWHGVKSGERQSCVSSFGVHDLTGNIDEWAEWSGAIRATSNGGKPINGGHGYPSMMKGGWWSKIRGRCQPTTSAHGPFFTDYQQGFRCCSKTSE